MREALRAGAPCDVIIAHRRDDRRADREPALLRRGTRAPLGRVRTGVAVRRGMPHPVYPRPRPCATALLAADAIYFPDPVRVDRGHPLRRRCCGSSASTTSSQPRFRTFPNGATAMRELAGATRRGRSAARR